MFCPFVTAVIHITYLPGL